MDVVERRVDFVNKASLVEQYPCALCSGILISPHKTRCGKRACKPCIAKLFTNNSHHNPCPMPHEDLDGDECLRIGLRLADVHPDDVTANLLFSEKCYCSHKPYGCNDVVLLKKLQDHENQCAFGPKHCPNKETGCPYLLQRSKIPGHLDRCLFTEIKCSFCHQSFPRKDIKRHYSECDCIETVCKGCGKSFAMRHKFLMHQRANADCLARSGRCYYYDYCGFESDSVDELRQHLREKKDEHLEHLTLSIEKRLLASQEMQRRISTAIKKKMIPLERVTAVLFMELANQQNTLNANTNTVEKAVKVARNTSQAMDSVESKVTQMEEQIKETELHQHVDAVEDQSQSIKATSERLNNLDKHVMQLEKMSFDGTLMWKIDNYKSKKDDAVTGRKREICSNPFFTSQDGYMMCLKAYVNGDGLGKGNSLSLFFVVMRGEFDDLQRYPFRRTVNLTLISPVHPERNINETLLPDPDSSSFQKPQTEMNAKAGFPQFAPHSLVESSDFLVNDCLYIRAVVEPEETTDKTSGK